MATGRNDEGKASRTTGVMPSSGHGVVSDQIPEAIEGLKITAIPQSSRATYYPETNPLVALGSAAEIQHSNVEVGCDHHRTRACGCRRAAAFMTPGGTSL